MKKIIICSLVLLLILACIAIVLYFFVIGVESNPTKNLETTCDIKEELFQSRKIFTITAKEGVENDNVILYFHGGSYVAELSEAHWNFVKDIVKDTRSTCIVVDYPLTPKYNKDDVAVFSQAFYQELIKEVEPQNIIMLGDSAGGGLALGLCEKLAEEQIVLPSKLLLISPWLDVSLTNPEIEKVQKLDRQLNKETLKLAGLAYASEENVKDYFVSPIYGTLENLKEMEITVYTGTHDILNPDVKILEKKAKAANVSIEIQEEKGAEHIWMILKQEERKEDKYYQHLIQAILENEKEDKQ